MHMHREGTSAATSPRFGWLHKSPGSGAGWQSPPGAYDADGSTQDGADNKGTHAAIGLVEVPDPKVGKDLDMARQTVAAWSSWRRTRAVAQWARQTKELEEFPSVNATTCRFGSKATLGKQDS